MAEWYVEPTGSNSAAGTASAPLRTIPAAFGKAQPGDTIIVRPGTYTGGTLYMPAGAPGQEITLRSETPRAAKLRTSDFAVIRMANYTTVEGFDLSGPMHGIFSEDVHHITMRGNYAHDLGNTGVGAQRSDFITIEDNECARCARDTWDSGISIYEPIAFGSGTEKLRIIIRGNVLHDNVTAPSGGPHTDGNGIILDDFRWTQRAGTAYPYGALVENNLCYGNGAKGIQVAWSDNNIIRRNTCVANNHDIYNYEGMEPTDPSVPWNGRGELSSQDSHGNLYEGNLAVADLSVFPTNKAIAYNYGSSTSEWIGNATFNGTPGQKSVMAWESVDGSPGPGTGNGTIPGSGNLFGVDPQLVDFVPTNPALAEIGWRPEGFTEPDPEEPEQPEPEPEEPDMEAIVAALQSLTTAMQAHIADQDARIAALEAAPTDPSIAERLLAAEGELVRLDGRLDAIAGAAGDGD